MFDKELIFFVKYKIFIKTCQEIKKKKINICVIALTHLNCKVKVL